MKKLPLGIQTFSEIREENYVYIDKTEHIYRLIQKKHNFFARPRRFGKSVLCSTLVSLFQGKKELFEGLWIANNSDHDFSVHPVIHIDFGQINIKTPELFNQSLMLEINNKAIAEGFPAFEITNPGSMLKLLMIQLIKKYNNKKIALIIDEYDRPILHHLTEPNSLKEMLSIIQNFYTCIKALDQYLRFLFVTGISRFSKTNLFSGFNHITDLSMDPQYAHLVGYTDEELNTTLAEHMQHAAQECELTLEEFKTKTKLYYNGYRFWENGPRKNELPHVYNPYSIMHNLDNPIFKFYWFESGTPTFLMNLLKKNKYIIESFDGIEMSAKDLGSFEPEKVPLKTLLYQTGYVTIESQDCESGMFTLTYPNVEVKEAFLQEVLSRMADIYDGDIQAHSFRLKKSVQNNDIPLFIEILKSFYATIPYTIHLEFEKYYQTIFYIILKLLGITIDVEVITNIGRIDALIKTEKFIYILEFKLNAPVTKAIEQIEAKKYFEQYQLDSRPITLVGISFDTKEKNIGEFEIKELKK